MAGRVSKDVIDQIRGALDIADVIGSYIQVKRTGQSAKALCPFHKEKTPSFHINPARQAFHCFGCGAGGDVFKFVMLYENVDFPTALRMLAARAGIAIHFEEGPDRRGEGPAKDELVRANEEAAQRYQQELRQSSAAAEARAYLERRALDPAAWKEWGIGYAPEGWGFLADAAGTRGGIGRKALEAAGLLSTNENGRIYDRFRGRVMFTLRDELGRAAGFSGRVLKADDQAGGKYVNTPETPVFRKSRLLFGLDKAKRAILEARQVLLVEGQIDCIRCHLAGFQNTVASQGTAVTEEHARLLKRYADHVIMVLDADSAGRKAALRAAALLMAEGLVVSLAALPAGEDPDSLILKGGPEAFAAVWREVRTPMDFLLDVLDESEDLRSPAGLLRATRAALDLAAHAQDDIQRDRMLLEAAARLHVPGDALRREMKKFLRQKYRSAPAREAPPVPAPAGAERPGMEVELASLLATCDDPEPAGLVRRWLPYAMISDPACRAVIQALAEEEPDLMAALDEESEDSQAFAAQIVNSPRKVLGREQDLNVEKAAQDLILRVWQRHLEARREKLGERMQALAGEERQQVLREYAQLLLDQGQLKLGWARAHPIIDLYLARDLDR